MARSSSPRCGCSDRRREVPMTTTVETPGGTSSGRRVQVGLLLQRQGALIALVILVVFGVLRYGERFATGFNLSSFTDDTAKYGLVALGMTFVIMTGGIDLSVGSVVALGGVVAIKVGEHGLLPGLLAGIAAGAAVGALNGFLITRLRLQPFIVTLATLLAVRGLALNLAGTRAAVDPRRCAPAAAHLQPDRLRERQERHHHQLLLGVRDPWRLPARRRAAPGAPGAAAQCHGAGGVTTETDRALTELADAVRSVPDADIDRIVDELLSARRIARYSGG